MSIVAHPVPPTVSVRQDKDTTHQSSPMYQSTSLNYVIIISKVQ